MSLEQVFSVIHVNHIDLMDTHLTRRRVKQFYSLEKLQEYTAETGKHLSKDSKYAGGVLKYSQRTMPQEPQ